MYLVQIAQKSLDIEDILSSRSVQKKIIYHEWDSKNFLPYNYGYFAFVYNNKKFFNPPKSMEELINTTDARIVCFPLSRIIWFSP